MVSDKVVIKNPTGLHLRPAGLFCKTAMQYKSKITVYKKMKNEEIEVHLGYKRVCSGSDPTYPVRWVEGSDAEHMARGSGLDKNLVVLGLHAEQNQEDGWRLSGDVELEQGQSQRNLQASVMLKKSW